MAKNKGKSKVSGVNTSDRGYDNSLIASYYEKEPTEGIECGELWLNRIAQTIKWRVDHDNGDIAWQKYLRMYKGDQWELDTTYKNYMSSLTPVQLVTVNIVQSTIQDMLPFLVAKNPKFIAKARIPDDLLNAEIQASLINLQWDTQQMQVQLEKCVLDWMIFGHCVGKCGFTFELNEQPRSKTRDGYITYNDVIKRQEPHFYRVNPFQFVFDITGRQLDLDTARWCCEIEFVPYRDVIANSEYDKSVIEKLGSTYSPELMTSFKQKVAQNELDTFFNFNGYEYDTNNLVLYKVHDKKYRKYYELLGNVPEPILNKSWPYQYLVDDDNEGFPYELVNYVDVPNEPYGHGLVRIIEESQLEKNRTRTQQYSRRQISGAAKYALRKGAVDPIDQAKFQYGLDGTIIELENPQSDIQLLQPLTADSTQFQTEGVIDNDIRELTGRDSLLSGGRLPSRTSANEINTRSAISGTKLGGKVTRLTRFVTNIGYKMMSHNRHNLVGDQVIQLIGKKGFYWQKFTRDNLSSRALLTLTELSQRDTDQQTDQQQAMSLFSTIMQSLPLLQQAGIQIDMLELFKYVFDKFDDKEVARFFPGATILSRPVMEQTPQEQPGQSPMPGIQSPPGQQNPQQQQLQQGQTTPQSMAQGFQGISNQPRG